MGEGEVALFLLKPAELTPVAVFWLFNFCGRVVLAIRHLHL